MVALKSLRTLMVRFSRKSAIRAEVMSLEHNRFGLA
jgi:hypothetical protein